MAYDGPSATTTQTPMQAARITDATHVVGSSASTTSAADAALTRYVTAVSTVEGRCQVLESRSHDACIMFVLVEDVTSTSRCWTMAVNAIFLSIWSIFLLRSLLSEAWGFWVSY
ncbi:hypothetical protein N7491_003218 [Penicillium cf. griseofulvum]|uniref:Uncharacterized protein n=1 Tax=Penicillium cf. griseofulvum TaxID=2972120 RepID=A0A9W9T1R0_9EURO|nr:hypothetical protein N7472_002610 [Penicillium cf. griseofulvum]KAJ5440812.1 hypothetical protein N7491_003218 [Penicillium cf. griseofulvum]KAJ5448858.1 hypothetical protein N7445_003679 [Penicillium cf. griseofulvum]